MNCKNCQKPVTSKGDYRHCVDCGWFKVENKIWKPVAEPVEEPTPCVTAKDVLQERSAQQLKEESPVLDEKSTVPQDLDDKSNSAVTQETSTGKKNGRAVMLLGLLGVVCAGIAIYGKRILCLIKKKQPEPEKVENVQQYPKLSEK